MADFRWCNADIGNGHVDIVGRISKDNGNSWGQEFTLARGSGINGAQRDAKRCSSSRPKGISLAVRC